MRGYQATRVAITLAFIANGFLASTWLVHIPELKVRLQISDGALGLALWSAAVGLLAGMLSSNPVMSKLGSRRGTLISTAGLAVSTALPVVSPDYFFLFPALLIYGFFNGLMDACMNTQAGHLQNAIGKPVMSSIHASWSIGSLGGALLGGALLSANVSAVYHVALTALVFLAILPWMQKNLLSVPEVPEFRLAIPHGRLILLGLICLLTMLGEGAIADWSGVYLGGRFQLSKGMSTVGYSGFFFLMFAARALGDFGVAQLGRRRAIVGGLCLGSLGLALALLSPRVWLSVLGFGLVGFGVGNSVPLVFAGAADYDRAAVGHSIAAVATFGYLGFFIGPALIGGIAQVTSLTAGLALVAAFLLTAGILALSAFSAGATELSVESDRQQTVPRP